MFQPFLVMLEGRIKQNLLVQSIRENLEEYLSKGSNLPCEGAKWTGYQMFKFETVFQPPIWDV